MAAVLKLEIPLLLSNAKRVMTFCNLKSVNPALVSEAISATTLCVALSYQLDYSVKLYNDTLTNILDKVAPQKTRLVSFTLSSPWYSKKLRSLKAEGRKLERLWRKTGLLINLQAFQIHQQTYGAALKSAKTLFYSNLIDSDYGNPRALFTTINQLLEPV